MTHPVIARRLAEQADRIRAAERFARELATRLDVMAAVVFGSTARGDFNKWSDTDVLVVARALPTDPRDRLSVLDRAAPPGVQPVGWTPEELADKRRRRDPIALECDAIGVIVLGALPA